MLVEMWCRLYTVVSKQSDVRLLLLEDKKFGRKVLHWILDYLCSTCISDRILCTRRHSCNFSVCLSHAYGSHESAPVKSSHLTKNFIVDLRFWSPRWARISPMRNSWAVCRAMSTARAIAIAGLGHTGAIVSVTQWKRLSDLVRAGRFG